MNNVLRLRNILMSGRIVAAVAAAALLLTIHASPFSVAALSSPSSTTGTVYFISFSQGKDTNNGTSPDSPWKTFQNLRNRILQPGDQVLLRRGDVWSTRMTIAAAGTENAPVYVGPYGDIHASAPRISLTNDRDDICIVVQDLVNVAPYNAGIRYIHIDNLMLTNSRVGIYFRNAVSSGNKGIKVTNCHFENMNCEPVMTAMLVKDNIPGELNRSKGDLDQYIGYYQEAGGGNSEYVWPVAILIGGRRGIMELKPGFSEIEIDNNIFEQCVTGVLAYYYNLPSTTNFFRNMRITNCQISGAVNGIMAVMGLDAGNPEMSPTSRWGVFRNLNILGGSTGQGFALGTTGLIIEDVANALFLDCNFSNVRNNGNPDGCGFDFESRGRNITIASSVFANNDGQGILMMDNHNGSSPHSNITIRDSLFYNNLQSVDGRRYRWDMCIWNNGNSNILLSNNRHVSKVHTAGEAVERINSDEGSWIFEKPRGYGSETDGITETGASFRRNDELSDFNSEIAAKNLTAALKTVTIVQTTTNPPPASPTPGTSSQYSSATNTGSIVSGASAAPTNDPASEADPSDAASASDSSVLASDAEPSVPASGGDSPISASGTASEVPESDSSPAESGTGTLLLVGAVAFVLAMALSYGITSRMKM
jgi:hypothetical protein